MVWGCMTTAGTWELRFIEGNIDSNMYCDILKQKMMPSLQIVFQHNQPKHTAKVTTTLLLKVKVMEWPSIPIEHMWGILKWKVEKHHAFNIQHLRDVLIEEWKRMPATTCAALVNSMPKRIKAVVDNNGAPAKYWHFGQFWHVHLGFTHFCCELFGQ